MTSPPPRNHVPPDPVEVFERARHELERARRLKTLLFGLVFAAAVAGSAIVGEVDLGQFFRGLPDLFSYIDRITPELRASSLLADVAEWYWALPIWLDLMLDTILISFLATVMGTAGALLLCFPASRNLVRSTAVYFAARRTAEVARAVPELVYALIFVFAFGIGPLAGVLAIAIHTVGSLTKLFSEVNENVDEGPIEGVRATGANWVQTMRLAVLPQVLPNFASYALLRFEINVRSAAVIGFVGAGGIGQELMFVIRQFIYTDISAIVLLIAVTVSVIDVSCERVRHRLIGRELHA